MELVGGLNLRFFQRSPFYEYARLQLDSCRPDQAKAALQVISSDHGQWMQSSAKMSKDSGDDHSCFESDSAFIEQYCNEIVQQGDLRLAEGDANAALEAYVSALKMIEAHFRRQLQSTGLRTTRSRCYRKILHLKATHTDLSDPIGANKLLSIMKRHEKATKHCENLVERVKCMHELGRVNVLLLQSPSAQAFVNIEQTISLLEEAYALGNHLGLSDLNKQLRSSLGASYLVQLKENEGISKEEATFDVDMGDFLPWASAILLSNSSIIEQHEDCSRTADVTDLELDKYLEQLSANLSFKTRASSREKIEEMVASVKQQVRRLPSSWLVVSVAVSVTSELVVSRITVSCLLVCLMGLTQGVYIANFCAIIL